MLPRARGHIDRLAPSARYLSVSSVVLLFASCRTPPPLLQSTPDPAAARSEPVPPPASPPPVSSAEPTEPAPATKTAPLAAAPDHAELEARYRGRPTLKVLRGEASYYGAAFAGRKTASGEVFDPALFTAAHRTLPFGTVLRVTRLDTRATVYVRVNDRGPFGRARRILDLSTAAAERLNMIRRGIAEVRADIVEHGKRPPARNKRGRRHRAAR
jgi:rare lipoprotein A